MYDKRISSSFQVFIKSNNNKHIFNHTTAKNSLKIARILYSDSTYILRIDQNIWNKFES
jgi:hypothetical protein